MGRVLPPAKEQHEMISLAPETQTCVWPKDVPGVHRRCLAPVQSLTGYSPPVPLPIAVLPLMLTSTSSSLLSTPPHHLISSPFPRASLSISLDHIPPFPISCPTLRSETLCNVAQPPLRPLRHRNDSMFSLDQQTSSLRRGLFALLLSLSLLTLFAAAAPATDQTRCLHSRPWHPWRHPLDFHWQHTVRSIRPSSARHSYQPGLHMVLKNAPQ